jgi:hypothetical protein
VPVDGRKSKHCGGRGSKFGVISVFWATVTSLKGCWQMKISFQEKMICRGLDIDFKKIVDRAAEIAKIDPQEVMASWQAIMAGKSKRFGLLLVLSEIRPENH